MLTTQEKTRATALAAKITTAYHQMNHVEPEYPADFLADYEMLRSYSRHDGCETFQAKHRGTGDLVVAKCFFDKSIFTCNEALLQSIDGKGLPKYIRSYENEAFLCVLWEYVEGITLEEFTGHRPLPEAAAVDIAASLCDILDVLHTHDPPLIHRDVKPQNIIVQADGALKLIDFGIARAYDKNASIDTTLLGAKGFAPPEQGHSQTDGRTDLFALGIVVLYLLTGLTDRETALKKVSNAQLRKLLKRCTEFAPKDRYSTAPKLKRAFLRTSGKRQKIAAFCLASMVACLLFLSAGFGIGRYTSFMPVIGAPAAVVFTEPQIEAAVRLQLDKAEGEPITREELQEVSELYIFGRDVIAKTQDELHAKSQKLFNENAMVAGTIRQLSDLTYLPNLRRLCISQQEIADITPLAQLSQLEFLEIKNNPIKDITPLSGLQNITNLSLFATQVTDFSPLKDCPRLTILDAGTSYLTSLESIRLLTGLQELYLSDVQLISLQGIEDIVGLRQFHVRSVVDGKLEPLLSLPYLQMVQFAEEMRETAAPLTQKAQFQIEYRR